MPLVNLVTDGMIIVGGTSARIMEYHGDLTSLLYWLHFGDDVSELNENLYN